MVLIDRIGGDNKNCSSYNCFCFWLENHHPEVVEKIDTIKVSKNEHRASFFDKDGNRIVSFHANMFGRVYN